MSHYCVSLLGYRMLLLLLLAGCARPPVPQVQAPTNAPPAVTNAGEVYDRKPFLRLETGMHTSKILRIAADKAERYLVSVSDDKTARVWDIYSGHLLQVLRPPLGDGYEGRLYAVAMSPDGAEVAVGGYSSRAGSDNLKIYLFDRASGRLTRSIVALPDTINHLSYSADGRRLAAALGNKSGIRLYDTASLVEIGRDSAYGDGSWWLDFAADGRLVSSSMDGWLRLYDPQLRLISKTQAVGGKQPFAVAFSPDGGKIAVGFNDTSAVNVLAADDLHRLYAPDTIGIANGNVSTVAWSRDGQQLYAGGRYANNGKTLLVSWPQAGRGGYRQQALSTNAIMALQPLNGGRLVYGSTDPVWGILNKDGKSVLAVTASIADYRAATLRLNGDGSQLEIDSSGYPAAAGGFDVLQQSPLSALPSPPLAAPLTQAPGLTLSDWLDNVNPRLNGQPLILEPYEMSRSLAISRDQSHFLLGTEWWLRYYDSHGQKHWQAPIPGVARAVNLSGDGRWAVAALGDGTIRWYGTGDGKERLALFRHPDGRRWVLWTPEGFYNASADAEALIGYHLNQGAATEGRFVSTQQLRERFFRPDLIAQRLQGNEGAIRSALAQIGDVNQVLKQTNLPPRLELTEQRLEGEQLRVKVRFIDQGGGIGKLRYLVNGVEQSARAVHAGIPGVEPLELLIPLVQGRNAVAIVAGNRDDSIASEALTLEQTSVEVAQTKPDLYVLAVGVTEYRDRSLDLKFADRDARDLAEALAGGTGQLFGNKHIKVLPNAEASLDNIRRQFEIWQSQVQANDVFVLFLAGHGKVFDGRYYFIPSDAVYSSEQAFRAASLDEDKLREWLGNIKAQKSLVLLDTCYAGQMAQKADLKKLIVASRGDSLDEKAAISRLNRATGRAILAATSNKDLAFEGYNGHGFFTAALLEGLQGHADPNRDKFVNVLELSGFLSDRVPTLSGNKQYPVLETEQLTDFPLGTVKP